MSRRHRQQARRHAQDRREQALEAWERWRRRADDQAADQLRAEILRLAEQPGWSLAREEAE